MESLLKKTSVLKLALRYNAFHTSCRQNGWRQSGNAMKKVLGAPRKKKLYFEDAPRLPTAELFSKGSYEGKRSSNSKRATVLNKLFMTHITDQLATGKCSTEVLGHGLEIIRVQVTPDYKILKVYWLAKGTANDEALEKILQRNSGLLRHELSQLRLMGNVPLIQFVKDKHYAQVVELDNRISGADFGDDHTLVNITEKLKTEFEILSPLNDHIKEKLKELDTTQIDDLEELPLPPMPQNVLGLNHADILDRIKVSKKKSEAPHRTAAESSKKDSWVTFKINQTTNKDPVQLGDDQSQRKAFKEFLQKRQLDRMKARQGSKNYIPDVEYIKEELHKRQLDNLSNFDIFENIEEDFIDEDLEESTSSDLQSSK